MTCIRSRKQKSRPNTRAANLRGGSLSEPSFRASGSSHRPRHRGVSRPGCRIRLAAEPLLMVRDTFGESRDYVKGNFRAGRFGRPPLEGSNPHDYRRYASPRWPCRPAAVRIHQSLHRATTQRRSLPSPKLDHFVFLRKKRGTTAAEVISQF